jgi:hypothetical protein
VSAATIERLVSSLEAATREYRSTQPHPPIRLELIESRDEYGSRGYTVIDHTRGTFADRLASDEALGVFAQALMGPPERPRLRYMQTYVEWVCQDRKWHHKDKPYPEPVALIGCNTHQGAL